MGIWFPSSLDVFVGFSSPAASGIGSGPGAAVGWGTVAVGSTGGGGMYASGMGDKKGACGCPNEGFNPWRDSGRANFDGGGGGGGGGNGNPIPGAVVARWYGGPVEKVVSATVGAVGENTVRGTRVR